MWAARAMGLCVRVTSPVRGHRGTGSVKATARPIKAKETAWAKTMSQGGPGEGQRNNVLEVDGGSKW